MYIYFNFNKPVYSGSSIRPIDEPIHMTLQEVRQYLQTLYSTSSDSDHHKEKHVKQRSKDQQSSHKLTNNNKMPRDNVSTTIVPFKGGCINGTSNKNNKNRKNSFTISMKNKKVKDSYDIGKRHMNNNIENEKTSTSNNRRCPVRNFPSNLKQTLCNLFRFRRFVSPETQSSHSRVSRITEEDFTYDNDLGDTDSRRDPLAGRALPPLPGEDNNCLHPPGDFASSIEKVKDVSSNIIIKWKENYLDLIIYKLKFITCVFRPVLICTRYTSIYLNYYRSRI